MNLLWSLSVPLSNIVQQDLGGHSKYCLGKSPWHLYSLKASMAAAWRWDLKMRLWDRSWQPCASPSVSQASLLISIRFIFLVYLSWDEFKSQQKRQVSSRNWFFCLPCWKEFIIKMDMHSTDLYREHCWVCGDGADPCLQKTHANQRSVQECYLKMVI